MSTILTILIGLLWPYGFAYLLWIAIIWALFSIRIGKRHHITEEDFMLREEEQEV